MLLTLGNFRVLEHTIVSLFQRKTNYSEVSLPNPSPQSRSLMLNPGMNVACVCDKEWFIGIIVEVSDETDDVDVSFMKQDNRSSLWPHREGRCWVPKGNVICYLVITCQWSHIMALWNFIW